ncbi:MAG: AAA family ATPase [Arcticibacter sp.]
MSVRTNVEVNIAKQKKNIAWALFFTIFSLVSYASWRWYSSPEMFVAESTLSVPGENTPADFWTNTGLVSAKTKATATIGNESFIQKAFEKSPAPAITNTSYDYADHTQSKLFPFIISVKQAPLNGTGMMSITDAGDSTYLLKNQDSKSMIGTYGQDMSLDGFVFNVVRKTDYFVSPKPIHTGTDYKFNLLSSNAATEHLLSGAGSVDVSQINDVIQVRITSAGDDVATQMANTLANAYKESLISTNGDSKTLSFKQQPEQITSQIVGGNEKANRLLDRLNTLQAKLDAQELLTRNIRERIDENYTSLSTEGIDNESIDRSFSKLAELYIELGKNPGDSETISSIENRKRKIGNLLIEARKETALQIEETKDELKNIDQTFTTELFEQPIATTTTSESKTEEKASLIAATILQAKEKTNPWAWVTAILGTLLIFMANRVTVFGNRYQILKDMNAETKTSKLPLTYPVVTSSAKNASLTQPVENLCADILSLSGAKTITISSWKAGEGKTFVATRLAMSLAALDKKTLIIDMNFRKPAVANTMGADCDYSISDVVAGNCDLLQAIATTSLPGLDMLIAGDFEHSVRGFLSWNDRDSAMKQLRNYYDYIIIDTDDLAGGPEAIPFLKTSDINLLVDSTAGQSREKTEKLTSFATEKELSNTFVVHNTITRKTPVVKAEKKVVKPIERTIRNTEDEQDSNSSLERVEKPTFLKRVALWFF